MSVTAIVGANWGDEGKGKITDVLAAQADFVVRFQGGNNAGHTIITEAGKFVLHLLPSGVLYPKVVNVLGQGVALNMSALLAEIAMLRGRGIAQLNLKISDRAQVVLPYHLLLDRYEEERLAAQQFGSTQKGIAPFYGDKFLKIGVQVADLFDEPRLVGRLQRALTAKNVLFQHLYGKPIVTVDEILPTLLAEARQIEPYICDTLTLLDVLGYLDEIPICTGYEIDGKVTREFPTAARLERAKPVLELMPGWCCDISAIRSYQELPAAARAYVERVEEPLH